MKKVMALFMIVLILSTLLLGCSEFLKKKIPIAEPLDPAAESLVPPMAEEEASIAEPSDPVTESTVPPVMEPEQGSDTGFIEPQMPSGDDGVDVDLTALSSTMVYGEVFNMMMEPNSYVGKTIKMRGLYWVNYFEPTDKYYHFVVIQDATACCAQGLDFIWDGEHVYPDDYPEEETEIEITGVWESYEEGGQIWYRIRTDMVKVL